MEKKNQIDKEIFSEDMGPQEAVCPCPGGPIHLFNHYYETCLALRLFIVVGGAGALSPVA